MNLRLVINLGPSSSWMRVRGGHAVTDFWPSGEGGMGVLLQLLVCGSLLSRWQIRLDQRRCLPLFSHPLKPLNAWLSFSGYLNWLRKWNLLLLDFRIHKTFKLLFWSFSSKWPKHEKHKKHDVLCSRKRFPLGKRKMIRRLVNFCGQGLSCNCVHRWYKILLLL